MTTQKIYQLPVEITDWKFEGATEIHFNWEYDDGSSDLLNLYEKGKQQQWDTSTRIDWSQDLFPDNPMGMADETIPIYGSPVWQKMTEKERNWLRFNLQCHSICQFMHGEQGALIATAKIVNTVPDMNALLRTAKGMGDVVSVNHPNAPSGEACMGCGWQPSPAADMGPIRAVRSRARDPSYWTAATRAT